MLCLTSHWVPREFSWFFGNQSTRQPVFFLSRISSTRICVLLLQAQTSISGSNITCMTDWVHVSVGRSCRYMRNLSKWPNINAQASETLRGPGFFDMPFDFSGPGYDLAHSTLLGEHGPWI